MPAGTRPDDDPEFVSPVVGPSRPRLLRVLGPGLITGASDDDPSGIATYAQAGAMFSYRFAWVLLYTYPLMVAVQMISARIGRTTGHGIAGVLRLHAPNWLLQIVVVLLLIANTANLGADLGAMADASTLLVPGLPRWIGVLFYGTACIFMQTFLAYTRYVAVLKWLCLTLFAYFAAMAVTETDWAGLATGLAFPHLDGSLGQIAMLVAIIGTTISPYLFFWQSAEEVEDMRVHPQRIDLLDAPQQAPRAFERIEIDTLVGMAFSNLVAIAILGTAAATLNVHGITDIRTAADAAQALRPLAGAFASIIFAAGIIGVGLLSVPVLAGSAAYAVGEARRWPVGYSRRVQEARAFYATVVLATIIGMGIILTPEIEPVQALYASAILNGVISAPIMVVTMIIAGNKNVMGRFAVRGALKVFGWLATAVASAAVLAMLGGLLL
jgi:Mn2+/Fe2+ NRAMP family transporter